MSDVPTLNRDLVFSQKNIWQLLRLYHRSFPRPFPAFVHGSFAFFLCLAVFVPSAYLAQPGPAGPLETKHFVKLITFVANFSLTAGVGLLSVAIAGFAIFASSLNVNVAVPLLTKIKKENGFPVVIFVYSFFVYTLATLLLLVVTSIVLLAFTFEEGAAYFVLQRMIGNHSKIIFLFLLAAQVGQITFVISIIKSFVWNLYESQLTISALLVSNELKQRVLKNRQDSLGSKDS